MNRYFINGSSGEEKGSTEPRILAPSVDLEHSSAPLSNQDGVKTVRWEEPKSARVGADSKLWVERLAPLMECPGRWARVAVFVSGESARSTAVHIKRPHNSTLRVPPGQWEAVSRKLYEGDDQGKYAIYARYLGPNESPRPAQGHAVNQAGEEPASSLTSSLGTQPTNGTVAQQGTVPARQKENA